MRNLLRFSTFDVMICKWWTLKILQRFLCTLILCGLCFYRAEDLLIFHIRFISDKATTWPLMSEKLNRMYLSMVLYNSTNINCASHYFLCLFFVFFAIWTNPLNYKISVHTLFCNISETWGALLSDQTWDLHLGNFSNLIAIGVNTLLEATYWPLNPVHFQGPLLCAKYHSAPLFYFSVIVLWKWLLFIPVWIERQEMEPFTFLSGPVRVSPPRLLISIAFPVILLTLARDSMH